MKTLQIEVETKKDCKMLTTWGVWQVHPYPDIEGHSGTFKWRNGGGLFGQCGNPPTGLGNEYGAVLLREGWTPETALDNRKDHAGYKWFDYNEPMQVTPGAIVYRGKSLGETQAEMRSGRDGFVSFRVRGFDTPTDSERNFLQEQVAPKLLDFVRDNAASLKAEVVQEIKARFASEISEARKCINELQDQANAAIARL